MKNSIFYKLYVKWPILLYDTFCIPLAWFLAYWFRFNLDIMPGRVLVDTAKPLIIIMMVFAFFYYQHKTYRGAWRYTSLNDLLKIVKYVCFAFVATIPILYFSSYLTGIPRSVLPLFAGILTVLLVGGRVVLRVIQEKSLQQQWNKEGQRILIIGAGSAGEGLVRDLSRFASGKYNVIGFVDDQRHKLGIEIHGVKVLGSVPELANLCLVYDVNLIFIAIPSANSLQMRRIVSYCNQVSCPYRTLPGIQHIVDGNVSVGELRKVELEDLLGRDQVNIEWDKIRNDIANQTVLITGAGGSIGSELCRQILSLNPAKMILIDNCEFNLYKIEYELSALNSNTSLEIVLDSVTNEYMMDHVFAKFKPQLVFHAAAYKHVPLLEQQIASAVHNNITGTKVVAQISDKHNVNKFILISTDKAVNPSNIMGATKRVAEIFCQNLDSKSSTEFITVRFGNVLGSAGSVVPLFQQQIASGGPVTVTHPDITRFFMTIPEACRLILQAMINGDGGEIFVLDMGEAIKISYLAEQLIRLSGKEPYKDIAISYTGLRPGEKLHEELFHHSEQLEITPHKKIRKAKHRKSLWHETANSMKELDAAYRQNNKGSLYQLLEELVPESQFFDKTELTTV